MLIEWIILQLAYAEVIQEYIDFETVIADIHGPFRPWASVRIGLTSNSF